MVEMRCSIIFISFNVHRNSTVLNCFFRLKVHLTDALWLGCGGAGVRVWLPLFPPRQSRHSSSEGNNPRGLELQLLTARRITLAFSLDNCYPLAVLFNEAVILGVTSETVSGIFTKFTIAHKIVFPNVSQTFNLPLSRRDHF